MLFAIVSVHVRVSPSPKLVERSYEKQESVSVIVVVWYE